MHQPRSTMNTALWTVQVLWGVFFSATGFGKVLCYNPALWNQALYEVPCFPRCARVQHVEANSRDDCADPAHL